MSTVNAYVQGQPCFDWLGTLKTAGVLTNIYVHLYTSPSSGVGCSTTLAQLTEAAFPGYAAIQLATSLWGAVQLDGDGYGANIVAGPVTWTYTGTGTGPTIYGVYLTAGGLLYAVAPDPYPPVLSPTTNQYTVTITVDLHSATCP
jgi:hypothetical protein